MRRFIGLCLVLCLLLGSSASAVGSSRPAVRRALLVGVDLFAQHPDTAPAAERNIFRLARALRFDRRGYYSIRRSLNQRMDAHSFQTLVSHSFAGALPQDTSVFYISTHGLYAPGQDPMDFAMVLSDGEQDYPLTARELHQALSAVQGTKVLIIDTCNSGALIDRGLPGSGLRSLFHEDEYKVLTASGGSEPSFLWTTGYGQVEGSSYFLDALLSGIEPGGRFSADQDRDGQITLMELHAFLLNNYGVSTPRAYPLNDQTPIFSYARALAAGPPRTISMVEYGQDRFSGTDDLLDFSYTLAQRSRVAYRLVYHHGDTWRFQDAQVIIDSELDTGETAPGRKERRLRIRQQEEGVSGYVLLLLTTVAEDRSTPYAEKLLLVQPDSGDPKLSVSIPAQMKAGEGEELPIYIGHAFPLQFTAQVINEKDQVIMTLARSQSTRPEHLPQGGSLIYWDGKTHSGEAVPAGAYRVEVTARIGEEVYAASSDPVQIM